ncbi:alkaline shock response membrane anchor protein AmaP [Weissella halotolerans]|uniref:Alkaline shock response membrane anchor protein AmaP n=1 Tax=Weissella halotolerans DSM 20190 TaxID=1123500 RepID=A0A0R2FZA9_9LACO|nr:alkaline shock response membrane anchor protein AmaP [Weissella halotolerans]KRN33552.1 hypothetical protein IV68_GL000358 [Weissella halotolerans DSM 20190]
MKKSKKWTWVLIDLLLALVLTAVALEKYHWLPKQVKRTLGNPNLSAVQSFLDNNFYWQQLMFWSALSLAIIFVLACLITLFRSTLLKGYTWHDQRNELTIDKKAIEGFIRSSIQSEQVLVDPKIKVALKRRKVVIKVRGKVVDPLALVPSEQEWAQKLSDNLQALLGIEQPKKIIMKIDRIEEKSVQPNRGHARVE